MKKQLLMLCLGILPSFLWAQKKLFVSPVGNDTQIGSLNQPLKTLQGALQKAQSLKGEAVEILFRKGTYVFDQTVTISNKSITSRSLKIQSYQHEKVVFSGGKKVSLQWTPYRDGIYKARLASAVNPDRLFLNGKVLPMARYPNFDEKARIFNGTAADALAKERIARWQNPKGGYIHALHAGEWGGFHFEITGKTGDKLDYVGGWQNNRPSAMNKEHRFVENIFEELDAPNEWYYNQAEQTLYFYPPKNLDLTKADFAISNLTDLIHIVGDRAKPVQNISIAEIDFTQTARSFMFTKEPLLRSDWTIYRGGALLLDGTEKITVTGCNFYELGGNAIFVSNYNKNNQLKDNHIYNIGASAISFVGSADAVRSPAFRYENFVPWTQMDFTKGPKSDNYPQYCSANGNLIHHIGTIEKQVAGTEISMAAHITISHNTIYDVPRAGINVSEGTWGGHIIEFNDVFNTVLETGDHGAFNSWGRDRYWRPGRKVVDSIVAARPGIEYLDVIDPIVLRNNRFQCDHGWDIDLDDGSTNYLIYNNVCLSGGLKLREGYHRTVINNIIINNTFHPHVWFSNSDDTFAHNIVSTPYAPIGMNAWGKKVDENFFLSQAGLAAAQKLGLDANSNYGDAQFIAANTGDYRVRPTSPALKTGFKNFEMNFGVTEPNLKKLATKPPIRPIKALASQQQGATFAWLGATFKNIESLGERSAAGLHDDHGALLINLLPQSLAGQNKLQKGDVIIAWGNEKVNSILELQQLIQKSQFLSAAEIKIIRDQQEKTLNIKLK
ncbi:PDZ domain-containing protein [Pedobacter sp. KR3-3]|uniref:PDZ domain-containing protein n=1 Tax=Pedobacter albus TaxID=3113905 RepID=A0ABU7I6V4_9SPHI|nr:PDZ domain-containing protein [Pedobacter sp. KR3-3]MEE1945026.1 PDZ domain-containing protein [Pedobacter sp. KR3-3]